MTDNEKFGTKLRELRKAAGLTLRELAERIAVNYSYLSKMETGALPPPSERVARRLAQELNYDKDELLALAGIIPADIAEILKDRQARDKLRAEQAKKEARSNRQSNLSLPKVALPWKGLYRLALPVFLVMLVALSIWFASPTQALQIQYPNQPSSGILGGTYTFYVKVSIQDQEHLPLESIDVVIYNVNSPSTYTATLAALPLGTSSAASHNPSEGAASGTATVSASADAAWGYSASGTGYAYFGGTGYSFTPSTSGGYGYQGGTGTTSLTYTIVWSSPSSWPAGTYQVRTVLTTSPKSPGGGTTFNQTSSTFTLSARSPGGGGGGGGGSSDITLVSDVVTQTGRFIQKTTVRSADGVVKLTIAKDVIGKDANGEALRLIRISPNTTPIAPPANSSIIGMTYNLSPNGATFDPPITLTFTYDPASLPEGTDAANLSLAYYDVATSAWVTLEGVTVDTSTHTISGQVSHFTTFAVIAGTKPAAFTVSNLNISPATIDPGDIATVTVTISNTGDRSGNFDAVLRIDENIVETKLVTLAGRSSQDVSFTIVLNTAGTYSVSVDGVQSTLTVTAPPPPVTTATTTTPALPTTTPTTPATTAAPPEATTSPPASTTTEPAPTPEPAVNWWLIAGIVAIVIIVGIVTWRMILYRAE